MTANPLEKVKAQAKTHITVLGVNSRISFNIKISLAVTSALFVCEGVLTHVFSFLTISTSKLKICCAVNKAVSPGRKMSLQGRAAAVGWF